MCSANTPLGYAYRNLGPGEIINPAAIAGKAAEFKRGFAAAPVQQPPEIIPQSVRPNTMGTRMTIPIGNARSR